MVRFGCEMAMAQSPCEMAMGMVQFGCEMAMGEAQSPCEMAMGMVQSVCEMIKGMVQSARDRIRFILSVSDNKASARNVAAYKTGVAMKFSNLVNKALQMRRQKSHRGLMDPEKAIELPYCDYSVSNTAGANLIRPFTPWQYMGVNSNLAAEHLISISKSMT